MTRQIADMAAMGEGGADADMQDRNNGNGRTSVRIMAASGQRDKFSTIRRMDVPPRQRVAHIYRTGQPRIWPLD
jgi:hypothetical protein